MITYDEKEPSSEIIKPKSLLTVVVSNFVFTHRDLSHEVRSSWVIFAQATIMNKRGPRTDPKVIFVLTYEEKFEKFSIFDA